MPRLSPRSPTPQLDLFAETPPQPQGTPAWTALPEQTRSALTGLMVRMLMAHADVVVLDPEGDDDDL